MSSPHTDPSADHRDLLRSRAQTTRWWRRRTPLVLAAATLTALVVAVLLQGSPATSAPLDPDNPGADGARAVARVLDHQGVDVQVVRGADALDQVRLDPSATVLVTSAGQLGTSTTQRLLDHLSGADLVVAEPDPGLIGAFGLTTESWTVSLSADRPATCTDPLLSGLDVRVDTAIEYAVPDGCFAGEHGDLVARPRSGMTFLGASQLLTNDQVLRADNAAVALRLLGQHPRLVWYVPQLADLVGGDGVSVGTLLPPWIAPGLWIAGAAVAALLLWRVRRLGPLVTEPLPVTVKAIETALSRGRLYRRAGDRAHAARALRRATRANLAARLHLPPARSAGDLDALVRDVASRLGRSPAEVAGLIHDEAPAPATDHDLITLASTLAALEREASRR